MSWNCENINIIEYKDKGTTTPVIEIESDDVSTNTQNLNYKETEVEHINSIDDYLNWSHHVLRSSPFSDECSLICLLKIDDFRKFIDLKKQIELKGIEFYLQRFDLQLLMRVCFIPTDENFSIKIEFTEDKQFGQNRKYRTGKSKNSKQSNLNNFCLIPKNNRKNNKVGKNNDEDSNDLFSNDGSSDESISTDFKNILRDNDILLDIHLGIHSKLKNFFTKNKKEKLKLNLKREIIFEDFFQYDGLVYEKLIDPFIFRIKITTPSINIQKCDEHIGIINEGNTCYMNSVIQSLFHIKHLRKAIYNIPTAEESPIYAIQKVFFSLQNDKSSIKLLNLFKSLNWEKSFWNSQQDVQEIFYFIFNLLSDQEKNYLDSNAQLSDLCEGNLKSKINCIDIEFESEKDEKFLFLQLFIENSKSLIECIERFISVESLTGDNRYETEDRVKHEATRTFMFSKIPQILFVQLKRFKCQGAEIIKVHRKIEYPEQLNLADYYSTKVDELIYSLYAVVVQDGNMNSGHYFVFIRDFKKNIWLKFNDTKVTYASEEEVFQQNFGGTEENFEISNDGNIITFDSENFRTAYVLIYVQKDRIEFLFQDLKKEDVLIILIKFIYNI
jgi:ubiquitin C-terminal hydrolase